MDFYRYLRLPRHLVVFAIIVMTASIINTAAIFFTGIGGVFLVTIWLLPALVLYALAIFLFHLYQVARQRDRQTGKQAGVALLVLCLAWICFFAMHWLSTEIFTWGTFAAKYNSYRRVIMLAEQGRFPTPGESIFLTASDGTTFLAERNAPHRIAFTMPGGFLNKWHGFLYDPAGIGKRPETKQVDGTFADLFDNYTTIEHCSRMTRHFYACSFS